MAEAVRACHASTGLGRLKSQKAWMGTGQLMKRLVADVTALRVRTHLGGDAARKLDVQSQARAGGGRPAVLASLARFELAPAFKV